MREVCFLTQPAAVISLFQRPSLWKLSGFNSDPEPGILSLLLRKKRIDTYLVGGDANKELCKSINIIASLIVNPFHSLEEGAGSECSF